jgi:hypothetical protein
LFSLNNPIKKLYANVPEMSSFNSKAHIQKYLIFSKWYVFLSTNVSDFYRQFTAKNQKKLSSNTFAKY